jgi:membrane fusion protein, multidrug efflux system
MPSTALLRDVKPAVPSTALLREVEAVPAKTKPKRDRKRWALSGGALLLAATAVGYGYRWWTVGRFIKSTDDAYVGGDVTVIAPKVAGFISQVAVRDNQAVHAGDLLVKLDDRDYRAALAKATAAVDVKQATLANLDATRRLQQAMVAQAAARVSAANAEIVRARDDEGRYRQLSSGGAASTQLLQKAEADYKKALASGQQAGAAVAAAERKLEVIDAERQQTRAALAEAVAERDLAELNVGYTEVRSPIDGTIGNRAARTGAFAAIGAQLLSVVPAHDLWVDANFKEDELARMVSGQTATVIADAMPGKVFQGHVASIAPGTGAIFSVIPPENATGNFTKIVQRVPVRIVLDGSDPRLSSLRPGLSTTVAVDTRSLPGGE